MRRACSYHRTGLCNTCCMADEETGCFISWSKQSDTYTNPTKTLGNDDDLCVFYRRRYTRKSTQMGKCLSFSIWAEIFRAKFAFLRKEGWRNELPFRVPLVCVKEHLPDDLFYHDICRILCDEINNWYSQCIHYTCVGFSATFPQ